MEVRGTLYKAGTEQAKSGKDVFKIGIRPEGGKDWELTLFDPNLIETCTKLKGKQVAAIVEKPQGEKYWNMMGIKEATGATKPASEPNQPKETDWDKIGRQKARCSILQAAVAFCNGVAEHDADAADAIRVAQQFEAYVFSEIPASKQPESKPASSTKPITNTKQEFLNACKAAGYSVTTKQGLDSIKAWIVKAGKTELPFDELKPDKQAELISMMKAEELPSE